MRAIIAVVAAVTAIATIAMLMGFEVDLWISGLFYDPSRHRFLFANRPWSLVRENGVIAIATCVGAVVAALAVRIFKLPSRIMPGSAVVFLVSSLVLGPGLLVNGILKEQWNRPRPAQVTQFGGKQAYVDWWDPSGTCGHNCSFVSGEASSAAWMFAPAMLLPPQWRIFAYAGAAIFATVMSFARVAAGRHFFTDVLFAILLTLLLIRGLYWLIFQWRRTVPESP